MRTSHVDGASGVVLKGCGNFVKKFPVASPTTIFDDNIHDDEERFERRAVCRVDTMACVGGLDYKYLGKGTTSRTR